MKLTITVLIIIAILALPVTLLYQFLQPKLIIKNPQLLTRKGTNVCFAGSQVAYCMDEELQQKYELFELQPSLYMIRTILQSPDSQHYGVVVGTELWITNKYLSVLSKLKIDKTIAYLYGLQWLSDNETIIFFARKKNTDIGYRYNIKTETLEELSTDYGNINQFNISPDNKHMLYRSTDPSRSFVMNLDGTNNKPLPNDVKNAVWSPDGTKIAAYTDNKLNIYSFPDLKIIDTFDTMIDLPEKILWKNNTILLYHLSYEGMHAETLVPKLIKIDIQTKKQTVSNEGSYEIFLIDN